MPVPGPIRPLFSAASCRAPTRSSLQGRAAPPGGACLLHDLRATRQMAWSVICLSRVSTQPAKASSAAHLAARLYTYGGRHTARVRAVRGAAV
eukprot:1427481-Prymnesium_polylepis.1